MIFFDIDGTLIDHKGAEYLAVRRLHKEFSIFLNTEEETFYNLWRKISDKYFERYLRGELTFQQQRQERIKELFAIYKIILSDQEASQNFQFYLKNYEDNWKLFDDVIPCFKKLHGIRLGIISNGDLEQQTYKLERLGIKPYFDIFITAGDTGIAKPDTKIFEIACARAGMNPQNCYYVGDNIKTDVLSCQKIGMKGIWINRKNKSIDKSNVRQISSLELLSEIL